MRQHVSNSNFFNVRDYGAKSDGKALDSPGINKAIGAAASAGGGVIFIPAGTYRSFSIRLKSNITIQFDASATLLAASPPTVMDGAMRRSRTGGRLIRPLAIRIGTTV